MKLVVEQLYSGASKKRAKSPGFFARFLDPVKSQWVRLFRIEAGKGTPRVPPPSAGG